MRKKTASKTKIETNRLVFLCAFLLVGSVAVQACARSNDDMSNGFSLYVATSLFPERLLKRENSEPLALTPVLVDSIVKSDWRTFVAQKPGKTFGLPLRIDCPPEFECRDGQNANTPFYCSPSNSYPSKIDARLRVLPSFTVDIGFSRQLPEELLEAIRDVSKEGLGREEYDVFKSAVLKGANGSMLSSRTRCIDAGFAETRLGTAFFSTTIDESDSFSMIGTRFVIPVSNGLVVIPQIAVATFSSVTNLRTKPPIEDFRAFLPIGIKFISGISLNGASAKSAGPNLRDEKKFADETPSLDQTVLSLAMNPGMPKPWTGKTAGRSFDWDDYFLVLEEKPKTVVESGVLTLGETQKNKLLELAGRLEYHFALFVYYKPGKNPSGNDSVRPCRIFTIESNDWEPKQNDPFLCAYFPTEFHVATHRNFGRCKKGKLQNVAEKELLSLAGNQLALKGSPTKLGNAKQVHLALGEIFYGQLDCIRQ